MRNTAPMMSRAPNRAKNAREQAVMTMKNTQGKLDLGRAQLVVNQLVNANVRFVNDYLGARGPGYEAMQVHYDRYGRARHYMPGDQFPEVTSMFHKGANSIKSKLGVSQTVNKTPYKQMGVADGYFNKQFGLKERPFEYPTTFRRSQPNVKPAPNKDYTAPNTDPDKYRQDLLSIFGLGVSDVAESQMGELPDNKGPSSMDVSSVGSQQQTGSGVSKKRKLY